MSACHSSPGLCQCYAPQDRNRIKGNEGLLITVLIMSEWLSSTEVTKSANGMIFLFPEVKEEKLIIHALKVLKVCACGRASMCRYVIMGHVESLFSNRQPPALTVWAYGVSWERDSKRKAGVGVRMTWCWSREGKHTYASAQDDVTASVLQIALLQQRESFSMLTLAPRRFIKPLMAPGAVMAFKWGIRVEPIKRYCQAQQTDSIGWLVSTHQTASRSQAWAINNQGHCVIL